MKRIISIIASLALMIGLSPAYAGTVIFAAEGDIAVNETNFPDENFRNWITANIKGASDGILTSTEISNVTSIIAEGKDIGNLQGIEYFTNLTSLSCSQNQLTALDVSKLTKLTILDCSINNLSSLTLGANTVLKKLYIFDNLLTSLDLGTRTLSGISVYQRIPALNITGESGAWKYDMSVLNIKDLSKVKIDDGQSAALDRTAGIVTFATADKPSKLSYTYDTGASIGDNSILLNVNVTEKVKNLDFVLTRNASNKYTVSVDNVPAGKQLLLIVPVAENGKTDAQIYDKYLQYYTKIMNGTDNIGHSAVGGYWLSSDDFTIKEITNNKTFDVDADLENQFIRGIGICITDPQEDSLYKLYQAGMTKGPIDIGSSSGNKINATAHNVTVTGGKASPSTAYKGDAVAITASNADTFDHWTSSADGVVFKDANSATTTFTMPDKDVTIAAVEKTSQDAPKSSEITDGKGKINGTTAQMEYSLDQIIWKVCTEGSTAVPAGTYYVRYAATDTKNASEAVKVTVTSAVTDDEDDDYQVVNTAVK